ncbi:MAG: hypothetical protein Q8N60_04965 [Candidatus Diapherotrites archaeon]|nr:hypothetical protein [Candidatus Diapherotrites archaeon]
MNQKKITAFYYLNYGEKQGKWLKSKYIQNIPNIEKAKKGPAEICLKAV